MATRRVIETSRSADLVTFKILSGGTVLSAAYQVTAVTVEKEVNRIPKAKIVLLDGDPATQDFKISNTDLFTPGREIEIKAGYHNDDETIFKGIVIKHSLKIRSSQSYLIIECMDKAVKSTIGRKSRYYYDSADSDILEEIMSSYGLETDIESTGVQHKEMVQYNASDWDFSVIRAQANGKICMADDGKFTIKKPDTEQEPVETVVFGATLLDFDAEIDARNQFSKTTAYSWNSTDQEITEAEGSDPGLNLNGNLSTSRLAEVAGPDNQELRSGDSTPEAALQAWSDSKVLFNQLSKTRGRLKFQGIPSVKPDRTILLEGVGDRFNGKVYVSAIRHQISEGNWTVDAEFGINPKWFSETYEINALPAAGLLAAVSGLQIGIVTQLQDDPDGEDRILVRLPIVDKAEEGIWARIATLDAGENRGSFFRPEIEDEVIVGFLNDNPNDAVILGMLNSSAKPAPLTASDDNHEKGFVTRSEMKFIFNDDKKSVLLETPGGKKIIVDEDAGEIVIEDENSNKFTLNSDGITLDSQSDINIKATGDVNIEGTNVSIKANAQVKAEGSAGAEVSSTATTVLKGSLVQIN
ncbi:type VI secretion system tip protein VgrG [Saccharicrinis sp. FJH54]|uniref:type VI secretion system tip protein VgrG n=1 Tax=Saccharicrinis sp. FJH54 TaxID=3344665 RepID=UPI0035D3F073